MSLHTLSTDTMSSHTLQPYTRAFSPFRKVRGSHVVVLVGFTPLVSVKAFAQIETHSIYCDTRGTLLLVSW